MFLFLKKVSLLQTSVAAFFPQNFKIQQPIPSNCHIFLKKLFSHCRHLLEPSDSYGATETAAERRRRQRHLILPKVWETYYLNTFFRRRGQRRQRKYSEVVTGSVSGSMARSMSAAYPQVHVQIRV